MKKKVISLLLCIGMCCVIFPTHMLAVSGNEAKIGETEYATLADALAVGGEVELLKNIEVNSKITVTKNATLNLKGNTITNNVTGDRMLHIKTDNFTLNAEGGKMIIPASNTNSFGFVKIGDFDQTSGEAMTVKNAVFNGVTYSGTTNNGAIFGLVYADNLELNNLNIDTNSKALYTFNTQPEIQVAINGGTYHVGNTGIYIDTFNGPISFNGVTITSKGGPCVEMAGGETTFENCNFTVTGDYEGGYSWGRAAIGLGYEAVATVKSGTYTARSENMKNNEGYGAYIYTSGGTLKIEGGTFAGTTAALRADVDAQTYNSPAEIIVEDGDFTGDIFAATNTGKEKITVNGGKFTELTERSQQNNNHLTVAGGIFDKSLKDFVSDDLQVELNNNGNYSYYKTTEEAIKEAESGAVINNINNADTALNATLNYNDETGKSVTLMADAENKITLPSITRSGHMFLEWLDENNNSYKAGQVFTLTDSITFTAKWRVLEKTHYPANKATCTKEGNIEYWYCQEIDKYFTDEALTQETTLNDVIIPATGHDLTKVEAKESTFTEKGNIEHYHCSLCNNNFADEQGNEMIKDVSLPLIEHANDANDGDAQNIGLWIVLALSFAGGIVLMQRKKISEK